MTSEFPVREQIARDIRALKSPCEDSALRHDRTRCLTCGINEGLEQAARVAEKVPHRDSWVTPDWVMVGVPQSEYQDRAHVMVLASTQLNGAEFIREVVSMEPVRVPGARRLAQLPQYRNTLLAEVVTYQTVYADGYPSALRDLMTRGGWYEPASEHPRDRSLSADGTLPPINPPE